MLFGLVIDYLNQVHFGFISEAVGIDWQNDPIPQTIVPRDLGARHSQKSQGEDNDIWYKYLNDRDMEERDKRNYKADMEATIAEYKEKGLTQIKDFEKWMQDRDDLKSDFETQMIRMGYKIGGKTSKNAEEKLEAIVAGVEREAALAAVDTPTDTPKGKKGECELITDIGRSHSSKKHSNSIFQKIGKVLGEFHVSTGFRIGNLVLWDIRINSKADATWVENFPGRSYPWNYQGKGVDNQWRFTILPYYVWKPLQRQSWYNNFQFSRSCSECHLMFFEILTEKKPKQLS
jgi:hypothetical protein